MLEIRSTDATEKDDSFEFKYVYIGTIYSLNDENLNIVDIISYQKYDCNYYDKNDIFESIIDLGKSFIKNCKINSLKDIPNSVSKHEKSTHKLITKWLLKNPYPYKAPYFSPDYNYYKYFLNTFVYDCVNCYITYDIHKWLIKIYNNQDIICTAPKESKELYELNKRLEFINFKEHIENFCNYSPTEYEIDLSTTKNKRKELSSKIELINKMIKQEEITIQDLQDYYIFIWSYITPRYSSNNPTNDMQDIPVIGKTMTYEPNIEQYRQLETADCLMNVAFDILNSYLTSRTTIRRKICKNPDCNNEFTPENNQEYCGSNKCKKYRNRLKSYNCYHGLTEPKKRSITIND